MYYDIALRNAGEYTRLTMNAKPFIWVGVVIGSTLGGLLPELWHASWLSFSGIIFSTIGGLIGIWAGWKFAERYN